MLASEKIGESITNIAGIGKSVAETFANIDIHTVEDLLFTFPRDYLDLSEVVAVADLDLEQKKTFAAEVVSVKNIFLRGKGRRTIQQVILKDETAQVNAVWFNMPFIVDALVVGERYSFVGKLSRNKKTGVPFVGAPTFEKFSSDMIHTARIVPVYRLTKDLSPKRYRRYIKTAIDKYLNTGSAVESAFTNPTYEKILQEELSDYLSLPNALYQVHFPPSQGGLAAAKFRLGIDELVPIQLKLLKEAKARKRAKAVTGKLKQGWDFELLFTDYWKNFPFPPTNDQKKACADIFADLQKSTPVYRLIQGDVGSGKTAVAGFLVYLTLLLKKDAVLMVPTTILANQHYETFSKVFPGAIELVITGSKAGTKEVGLLPGKQKNKIYIGTQALLHRYENIAGNIGTFIVDEEHRFGVKQREEITRLQKKTRPHFLSLTATPIPRSLALALFGNIDISVIREKPPSQIEKKTYLVPEQKRADSYKWIENLVAEGNQVFWICPLIEERKDVEDSEAIYSKTDKATVEAKYRELKEIFPELGINKLHGQLKADQKERLLEKFRNRGFDILISTTVIEVGIDIPNANVIVIESAERFGLAQLHQLRGRVGRGKEQGYCLLFSEHKSERLDYFAKETDGLKLAEFDLQNRGAGEVYGTLQSGVPNLKIADITNPEQLRISRKVAEEI